MGQLRDDPWVLRRAIGYLTGGLFGLSRTGGGDYDVTVVRPRRDGPAVDPGWDIGQIGAHDYAVLHALAHDDSGQPGESDLGVADPGPAELRFPPLDLSTPSSDDPAPAEPFGPAEVDVFA
ncbi:hypothetical protein [Actinomadura sp. DC4]|uniref:hypothetical protein n=1 Tax=Actinomadura sp. DC4 TaxID=3055069 RepID=UPI0025B08886|nr:hypothetical protein [Actinomadura sp. DC4]MDN3355221.1 hypothetical protein [Actinomadura sp. DC4]